MYSTSPSPDGGHQSEHHTFPEPDTAAPVEQVPLAELESRLLGLAGHLAAAQCRFLGLLAEFDRRDG